MSADADRIETAISHASADRACGRAWVCNCGACRIVRQAGYPADRIAQLTAELAEARAASVGIAEESTNRAIERDAAQADAAGMRDWCAAWLIRARLALYREGWEPGMTMAEMSDALTSVLFNLGCDDGSERPNDIAKTKRLLAMPITYVPPGGRALAERVTLLEIVLTTGRAYLRRFSPADFPEAVAFKAAVKALDNKGKS